MLDVKINTQPDDETCGPTCLHAIYRFYGDNISPEEVIKGVGRLRNGGTLAALLGTHALKQKYSAMIYVYNLDLFDPSWFHPHKLNNDELILRLKNQLRYKKTKRMKEATHAFIDFLKLGGELVFRDLNASMLKEHFDEKTPILAGLSATYLYQSPRERTLKKGQMMFDDLRGEPCGHFVVLSGYDEQNRRIVVADPHKQNPLSSDNYYRVNSGRLMSAIMLGALTFDANLLVIQPKKSNA